MFPRECEWIKTRIEESNVKGMEIVDIGSNSEDYRNQKQWYIGELYEWMKNNLNLKIKTLDLDPNSNADFILNIGEKDMVSKIGQYDLVMANNILEHVEDNKFLEAIKNLKEITKIGGYLVITCPHKLDLHPSPIDNGFRPDYQELEKYFPDFRILKSETWKDEHYREPFISNGSKKPEVTGFFGKRLI